MYEEFFGLKTKPFELLPNPDFLYMSKGHKRAIKYLEYGIRERAGFILLTGDIGAGKSTLVRNLLKHRDERMVVSRIFNTKVKAEQLLGMIADDFGIPAAGNDKVYLLRELNRFLIEEFARGRQPVLIIDEAQNLAPDVLEEIRMLSNLETDSAKLLQIILVGQPELRQTLSSPRLEQLRQRISVNCSLLPLTYDEMGDYIHHRLEVAGNREAVSFSSESLDAVHRYSKGIPRLINIICDFIMLAAFAEETKVIESDLVKEILGDLNFNIASETESHSSPSDESINASGMLRTLEEHYHELHLLLRNLTARLDVLENDSARRHQDLLPKVNERLTVLEEGLLSRASGYDQSLKEVKDMVEKIRLDVEAGFPGPKEELPRSATIFNRIFGW